VGRGVDSVDLSALHPNRLIGMIIGLFGTLVGLTNLLNQAGFDTRIKCLEFLGIHYTTIVLQREKIFGTIYFKTQLGSQYLQSVRIYDKKVLYKFD